jgi:microcin C transport system substrate-binding protein
MVIVHRSALAVHRLALSLVVASALVAAACGGGTGATQPQSSSNTGAPAASRANVSTDKNAYPVFPNADAGADPSVPAEEGGKGFKGDGWETNSNFDLIGDPRAVKGGVLREYQPNFPGTLRINGPEANTALNQTITNMVYETLLGMHPTTLEYMPALATHWQISADKMSYRFRLDPNARFSDGQPVTSDDVVATWSFLMDKGLQDPMTELVFAKFEKPVAESKYIVSVKSKVLNWRNFMYFAQSMPILPAHVLKDVDGARYVKEYNFKLLPGSGAYRVDEADVVKGKSVTIRRRNDYWADGQRRNIGGNNFDELREIVVRDQNLAFEMFKKGDLDYYPVNISRQWIEEMNFDRVQRGLVQKRKIYNDNPQGVQGLAMNTRKAPFNDVRVREALQHLLNRPLLIQKLFFNEYTPMNSYYAGSLYENPKNPKNEYDPELALKQLADAGWKDRDAQGRLVKNGQPLAIELLYDTKTFEPTFTIYQDDLRKVGIALNLRLVTPETLFQLAMERKFDVMMIGWTGLLFPNPETSYHSTLADKNNTNNITGFKNARVDELLDTYDVEFDQQKRVAIIREIDGILANSHDYVLQWQAPFQRIAYWNKFGMPEGYLSRFGDYRDLIGLWWIDPDKQSQLTRAMADSAGKLPVGQTEVRYWTDYAKQHSSQTGDAPATK